MPKITKLVTLLADERQKLERIAQRSEDWRERQRAQTVLFLAQGKSVTATALQQNLCRLTVRNCRETWLTEGFAGLKDKARRGAPAHLQAAWVTKRCEWAKASAQTAADLCRKLLVEFQVTVAKWVVRQALKRQGFVWKRTRHRLKKTR